MLMLMKREAALAAREEEEELELELALDGGTAERRLPQQAAQHNAEAKLGLERVAAVEAARQQQQQLREEFQYW